MSSSDYSDSSDDPDEYVRKGIVEIDKLINILKIKKLDHQTKRNNAATLGVRDYHKRKMDNIDKKIQKLEESKSKIGNGIYKKKSKSNIYRMPKKSNKKGGLDWEDVKSVGRKALGVAKDLAPLLPVALGAYKALKGGAKLKMKDAPKKTPQQLKPWMRVVETTKRNHPDKSYKEILMIAKKIYRSMK